MYHAHMNKQRGRPGVSKTEWLEAGLQALGDSSVAALTVEGLAKSLGIAKAGFYWHFKNRDDLLRQLLDHWTLEPGNTNPQTEDQAYTGRRDNSRLQTHAL